jgi:ATP-binding cassette, subfamily C, bacterial LapB
MTQQDAHHRPDTRLPKYQAETVDDPLLDCLMQLGRIYNLQISRTAMRAGLPLVDNRLTVELFPRAAERAGLASRLLKRPLTRMTGLELPAVLLLNDGRACLLAAVDTEAGQTTVLLPETGLGATRLSFAELDEIYSGYALFVRPRFRQDTQPHKTSDPGKKTWFWGTLFSSWRITGMCCWPRCSSTFSALPAPSSP